MADEYAPFTGKYYGSVRAVDVEARFTELEDAILELQEIVASMLIEEPPG
jgi:hypothetical protein